MDPFTITANLLSFGLSVLGGKKKRKQARREAEIERTVTRESVRRLDKAEDVTLGRQQLATARNLVDVSSKSALEVRQDTISEFEHERQLIEKVGASRARAALDRGRNAQIASYAQAGSSLLDIFAGFGNNKKNPKYDETGGI